MRAQVGVPAAQVGVPAAQVGAPGSARSVRLTWDIYSPRQYP